MKINCRIIEVTRPDKSVYYYIETEDKSFLGGRHWITRKTGFECVKRFNTLEEAKAYLPWVDGTEETKKVVWP